MLEPGWEVRRELVVKDKKTNILIKEEGSLVKIFTPDKLYWFIDKKYVNSLYETLGLYIETLEREEG